MLVCARHWSTRVRRNNALVIRRGAETEVQSGVERAQADVVESQPEVALGSGGERLMSKETVVLISLNKRATEKPSNVVIRGVGPQGLALRPQVRLVEGRMFRPGTSEIIAGRAIGQRFAGAGIGETLRFGMRDWTVVGQFDAGHSGFNSEIWGDADQLIQAFRRSAYSSVIFRLTDAEGLDAVKARLESDPRLTVELKRESIFYAEQSEQLSTFIRYLGVTLSIIFSSGATIGAMITMYASVANRTARSERCGRLAFDAQAFFGRSCWNRSCWVCWAGYWAWRLASLMQWVSFSTMNFQTFSELAFSFTLTGKIVVESLIFSLIMGLAGGFLPAIRAARLKIVDSLRAA
jgi:ABC-type lipoprotein release transport system permease subunit